MSNKPRVLVTRQLPPAVMELLHDSFELSVSPHDGPMPRQELLEAMPGQEGLLSLLVDKVDGELLDAVGQSLRMVANYAVGYNNIDLEAATSRGIVVSNTPDVLTDTTADLALGLMLAVARRMVEADALTRPKGCFPGWGPMFMLGADLHHKTLGLIGLGRIGRAVARRAQGFDMSVLYHQRNRLDSETEKELGVEYRDLDELLTESDFVSPHVPLTPGTKHLIGQQELGLMKSTAYLVNTARGEVVDESALVKALESGVIAGAGLDVYENEPELHPGLLDHKNVVLIPHLGSATLETRTNMGLVAAGNLRAMLVHGRTPPNCLNSQVLDQN
jgi:glyoxylate reductase